jgi:hypothetical protein
MKIRAGSWIMLSEADKLFILKAVSDRSTRTKKGA